MTDQIRFATSYDVGLIRSHNEDALLTFTCNLSGDGGLPACGLFVIADGMGGHLMGERASGIAARTMARVILEQLYLSVLRDGEEDRPALLEAMELAVQAANRAVSLAVPGGGTTLTSALIFGRQLTLAHVGDSRAYLVQPDRLKAVTRDHTLVQRLIDLGQLTSDEAVEHPHKNVLVRALGQQETLEVDVATSDLSEGNLLLLCSDGLWGSVSDGELFQIISNSESLQQACDQMVHAANRAGGTDNIAAILVELPGHPAMGAASP